MARKLNLSKLQRQINGVVPAVNRRPAPPAGALYLMQLRAQAMKITAPPRRVRLHVTEQDEMDTPKPVRIIKLG